jgi:hypothetical protein
VISPLLSPDSDWDPDVRPIIGNLEDLGVYDGLIHFAHFLEGTIRGMPLEAMVASVNLAEAYCPILDPRLFRQASKKLAEDQGVLVTLLSTQKELVRLFEAAR